MGTMPRKEQRYFDEMSNYSYDLSVESKIQDKFISGVNGGSNNSVRTIVTRYHGEMKTTRRRPLRT